MSVAKALTDSDWMKAALARVAKQEAIVETQAPGSEGHRLATETLLLLKDSLHELAEAKRILSKLAKRD